MLVSFSECWIRWWLQTGLRGRDEANNERLVDIDNNDSDEDDNSASKSSGNEENENDYINCW